MPIPEHAEAVPARGNGSDRGLQFEVNALNRMLAGRVNPRVTEYGSGLYGVAMPTLDPRWTFKITRDRTEAAFVNAVRRLGLRCSLRGIVRCSPVYETEPTRGRKEASARTFVYWREAASTTGDDAYLRLGQLRHGRLMTMVTQAKKRIEQAMDIFADDNVDITPESYDAALAYFEVNPLLAETGEDLRRLAAYGILVTDTHLGNWGIIPRRPTRLTLIDPGLVRFMTPEARDAIGSYPRL